MSGFRPMLRSLARQRGLVAAVTLIVALGVGATTLRAVLREMDPDMGVFGVDPRRSGRDPAR